MKFLVMLIIGLGLGVGPVSRTAPASNTTGLQPNVFAQVTARLGGHPAEGKTIALQTQVYREEFRCITKQNKETRYTWAKRTVTTCTFKILLYNKLFERSK